MEIEDAVARCLANGVSGAQTHPADGASDVSFKDFGFEFSATDGIGVDCIRFHWESELGSFAAVLRLGVRLGATRESVHEALGKPDSIGKRGIDEFGNEMFDTDVYELAEATAYFVYNDNSEFNELCLVAKDRFNPDSLWRRVVGIWFGK